MTTAQYHSLALTQERLIQQVASVEAKVDHMSHDIGILCKLVRDGNGQPSIMQRLAQVETVLEAQVKDLEQISQYANSMTASRMLTRTQLVVGLSGMILTVLLSSFSVYAAIMK
jgi:hypothetical protein